MYMDFGRDASKVDAQPGHNRPGTLQHRPRLVDAGFGASCHRRT